MLRRLLGLALSTRTLQEQVAEDAPEAALLVLQADGTGVPIVRPSSATAGTPAPRRLGKGLSEWAVHPGLDDAELRAIQPEGARVRQTDFDVMISAEAREVIQREGITLLSYKQLRQAWQDGRVRQPAV